MYEVNRIVEYLIVIEGYVKEVVVLEVDFEVVKELNKI